MAALALPRPKLSQGTIVVGVLLGAWVLWLAAQNKLLIYWQILMGQGGAQQAGGSTGGATTTAPSPAPAGPSSGAAPAPAGQAPFTGAIP